MKNLLVISLLALCATSAVAEDYQPFVIIDSSSEKDKLANEYINANITLGVKGPNKFEYSVKSGVSVKDAVSTGTNTMSANVELKIKKSFDVGLSFTPYLALRLGEKINPSSTTSTDFAHWAIDAGLKQPISESFALDIGTRYRDSFAQNTLTKFQSLRYHATLLYEFDKANILGLRYTTSTSTKTDTEARDTWRLHYQHNY